MLSSRDHFHPHLVRFLSAVAERPLVLDLGTYRRFNKELAEYAGLFRHRYFTMDLRRQPGETGPDVLGDIHTLPFQNDSVSGVICKEVLEHVVDPHGAVREIHRILEDGGLAFCSVPFLHPYHGCPSIPDYWRFTEEGLKQMFSCFSHLEIQRAGGALFVFRAFSPAPVRRWLFSAPLMPFINAADRVAMSWGATNLFLLLARK